MSEYSKLMLWASIAVELAYIGFFVAMTDGLTLGDRSPGFMVVAVVGFLVVVAVGVFIERWFSKPVARSFPDEREQLVDARSEQIGARVLDAGVFGVVILAIYEASAGPNSLGSYSLTRPEALVFAMITISSLAAISRMLLGVIKDLRT